MGQMNQTRQFHSKSSDVLLIAKDTKREEVQNDKNKLVFLGHSCIWIPCSPAKTGKSEHLKLFSTSASGKAESPKEKLLNEPQKQKGKQSNLQKDVAQQVCETKPDLDAIVSRENSKNAKMSGNSSFNLQTKETKSGPVIRIKPNNELISKNTSVPVEKHEKIYSLNLNCGEKSIENSAEPTLNWKNKIDGTLAVSSPPNSNLLLAQNNKVNSTITANVINKTNEDKKYVENSLILDKNTHKIKKISKDFGDEKQKSSKIELTKQKLENDENKKLVFVGHSATWIPNEAKPEVIVTIPNNKKQIFFVGHSCTWVPENMLPEFLEKFAIKKPQVDVIEVKEKDKVNTRPVSSKSAVETKVSEKNLNEKEKIRNENLNNRDKNLKTLGVREKANMLSFEQFKEKQSLNYKNSPIKSNEKIVEVEKSNGIRYIPRIKKISNEPVVLSSKNEHKNENLDNIKKKFTESTQIKQDKNLIEKNFMFLGHPVIFEKGSWILQLQKTPNAQDIMKLAIDDGKQHSKSTVAEVEDNKGEAKKSKMISIENSTEKTTEKSINFIGHSIAWLPKELEIKTEEKPKFNQLNIVGSLNDLTDKTNQGEIMLQNQGNKPKIQINNKVYSPKIAELSSKFKSDVKSDNGVLHVKCAEKIQPKTASSKVEIEPLKSHQINPRNVSGSSVEPKMQQKSSTNENVTKYSKRNNPVKNEENSSSINKISEIMVESKVDNQLKNKSADICKQVDASNEKNVLEKSSKKINPPEKIKVFPKNIPTIEINEAQGFAAFDLENWMEDKLIKSENKKRMPVLSKKVKIVASTLTFDASTNTNKIITKATGVPIPITEKNNILENTSDILHSEIDSSKMKEQTQYNKFRLPTTFDIAIKKIDEAKKLSAIDNSSSLNLTTSEQPDKKKKYTHEIPKSDTSKENLTPIRMPPNAEQVKIFSSAISDALKSVKFEKLGDSSLKHSVNDNSSTPDKLSEESVNQLNNYNLQKNNIPKFQTVVEKIAKNDYVEKSDSKKLKQQNKSYKGIQEDKLNIKDPFPIEKHEAKLNTKQIYKSGSMDKKSDISTKDFEENKSILQKLVGEEKGIVSDNFNNKVKISSLKKSKVSAIDSTENIVATPFTSSEMQKSNISEVAGTSNILNKLEKDRNVTESDERNKMSNSFILIEEASSTTIKQNSTPKLSSEEKGFVLIKETKDTQLDEQNRNEKQLRKSITDHVEAANLMKTDIFKKKPAEVSSVLNEDIEKNLKREQIIGKKVQTNIKQFNDIKDKESKINIANFDKPRADETLNQKSLKEETKRTASNINEIVDQISKPLKGKNIINFQKNNKILAGDKKENLIELTSETHLGNVSNFQIDEKTFAGKKKENVNVINLEKQPKIITKFQKEQIKSFTDKKEEKLSNTNSEIKLINTELDSNKTMNISELRKSKSNLDKSAGKVFDKKPNTGKLTETISKDIKQQSDQKETIGKFSKTKTEKIPNNVLAPIVPGEIESGKFELVEKSSNTIANTKNPSTENLKLNEKKYTTFGAKNNSPFSRWIDNTLETEYPTKSTENDSQALKFDKIVKERQPKKQIIGDYINSTETTFNSSTQKDAKDSLKKTAPIERESNVKNTKFQSQNIDSQKADEIIKKSAHEISSIIHEKLNDAAVNLQITSTNSPKILPKPENIFEISNDVIQNKSLPKKGLIVKKNQNQNGISKNDIKFGASQEEIVKGENFNKINANPLVYNAKSPLERVYNEIDKKIDEIQEEINEIDKKTKVTINVDPTTKTVSKLKSTLSDNQLRDLKLARTQLIEPKDAKIQKSEGSLKLKLETVNPSQTSDDIEQSLPNDSSENMPQERRPYIPFSFEISRSVKDQFDTKSEQRKQKLTSPIVEQYKSYFKTSNGPKITLNKTTLFQELKTMIKEDLFSNPEIMKHQGQFSQPIEEITSYPKQGKQKQEKIKSPSKDDTKEEKSKETELSVESCASQPNVDGTMKPATIFTEIKNLIKEELFTHPPVAQKTVENNLKVSKDKKSVEQTLKIVEQSNNVEISESKVQKISKSSNSKLSTENMIPMSIRSPPKENHDLENVNKIEAEIETSKIENTSKNFTDLDEKGKLDISLSSEVKENLAQNQPLVKNIETNGNLDKNIIERNVSISNVDKSSSITSETDNLNKMPETFFELIKYLFNQNKTFDSSQSAKNYIMPVQKSVNQSKDNVQEFIKSESFEQVKKTSDLSKENLENPTEARHHSTQTNVQNPDNNNNDTMVNIEQKNKNFVTIESKQESLASRIKYLFQVDKSSKPENVKNDTEMLLRLLGEKESVKKNIEISEETTPTKTKQFIEHSNIEDARETLLKPLEEKTSTENDFKIKENNSPDSSPTHKFLDHKLIEQERSKLLNLNKTINSTEKYQITMKTNTDRQKPPKLSLDLDQISEFKILPDNPPSPLIEKINSSLNKKTKFENEINSMIKNNDNSLKMGSIDTLSDSNRSEQEIQPGSEFRLAYNRLKNYFTEKTVEKSSLNPIQKENPPNSSILNFLTNLNTEEIKMKQNVITSGVSAYQESELSLRVSENKIEPIGEKRTYELTSNILSEGPSKVDEESKNSDMPTEKMISKKQTESKKKVVPKMSENEILLKQNIPEFLKSTSTNQSLNTTIEKNTVPGLDDEDQEKKKDIPKKNKTDDEKSNFDVFSKIININLGNHLDNKDYPKTRENDTNLIDKKNSTSKVEFGETTKQTSEGISTNQNFDMNSEKTNSIQKPKTDLHNDKKSDKKSIINFSSLDSTSNNSTKNPNLIDSNSAVVDLDRYNSFEANPFSKNQVLVKILCSLKLASIRKD